MKPRNRFQGMISTSLCSLAGRYDNPIPPRFLAPVDSLKIPALNSSIHSFFQSFQNILGSVCSEVSANNCMFKGPILEVAMGAMNRVGTKLKPRME
jgi:hypothetical protein